MARPDGNPHDGLVKFVFKDPAHAGPLLRSLLPDPLVRAIDWSSLQRHDVTLIEPALRETRTDLVFTAELAGQNTWIYVLFEHQSERDPWMALRLLGYMTRLWEDQRRERGLPLSPIVQVVLHHGEKSWTEGTRLGHLFALPDAALEPLREHCPDFRFLVDDLSGQDDSRLRQRALTELAQVALVLLRDGRRIDDLERCLAPWLQAFRAVAAAPDGASAMFAVFRYLSRVAESEPEQLLTFAREIGPTAEKANMTAAEQIAKEAEERGRRKGREEGRRELLVKLITLRFGAPDAATLERLDAASADQLSRCAERVLDASTLDDVLAPCLAPGPGI